jgi:hypothetical protein
LCRAFWSVLQNNPESTTKLSQLRNFAKPPHVTCYVRTTVHNDTL